ncbi:MAG: PhoX family phosphatase [Ramlibacter sp.]|jgi:secreted PhoX family phosphatase|nr:PhoX family phosphatase [Ramlibacter sp.]
MQQPPDADRRVVLTSGVAAVVALLAGGCAATGGTPGAPAADAPHTPDAPGFTPVPPSAADSLAVPPGYEAALLYKWGDPTGMPGAMPPWRPDASTTAVDQAVQAGMHHDGMHFFPLAHDGQRGLLVLNHEYTDEGLLHGDGARGAHSLERVRKSQHAMGVSVIEVAAGRGGWQQLLPSRHARRIHGNTPMRIAGPAAGAPAMRTALNPAGDAVLGTFANCAMGVTPWGTYLTCEENFQGYFGGPGRAPADLPASLRRYGVAPGGQWVDWWQHDERFDVTRHPNEANRFGWVVEIDPMDPTSTPVKRTALGRKRQESATCTLTRDGRVAVYMGDDGRFEYIYKFVSRDRVRPGGYAANRDLLDHGTLYAARFDTGGRGQWLALQPGAPGLATLADVVINARGAADAAGATPMDRPEWIAVHPQSGEVFVTLTNNTQRGLPGRPAVDAANPRAGNGTGHIIRWREAGADAASTAFDWDIFALAGDPAVPGSAARYPTADADAFGAPDGLHFDSGGLLWIQTDMSGQLMHKGPLARLGNNQMLCANLATGRIRRFMTGPRGCEITGCVVTPDRRTLFVNIQHPGETSDDGGTSGHWPDGGTTRPRSAIVAVRRTDGGVVGT